MMGREDIPTTLNPSLPLLLPGNFCHGDDMPRTHNRGFYLPDFDKDFDLEYLFPIFPVL